MSQVRNPNKNVTATIDGIVVTVPEGTTILNAAQQAGIKIPILCHHPDLKLRATCRVCVVEVKGQRRLQTACNNPLKDGAEIFTTTNQVRQARKTVLELILADHPQECLTCVRNGSCELQQLAKDYNLTESPFGERKIKLPLEQENPCLVRDMNKCIKCTRCVEACQEVQQVFAISTAHRSGAYSIGTAFEKSLTDSPCVFCGHCINVCPVGALTEKNDTQQVWDALADPNLHVLVLTDPVVPKALCEAFGLAEESSSVAKMAAVLRRIGFAKVFAPDFVAELARIEETKELLKRTKGNGKLPLLISCETAAINLIEAYYPDLLPHLSGCKSAQQLFGVLAKTDYAKETGISPEKIYVVALAPYIAKKAESVRPEMNSSGYRDVDAVLTTREFIEMIRMVGIDFAGLAGEEFDPPWTRAETALRAAKAVKAELDSLKVEIAVVNSLREARQSLDQIRAGEAGYQALEIRTPGLIN